jgi:two-component system, sensor histidine kinase and response regulator
MPPPNLDEPEEPNPSLKDKAGDGASFAIRRDEFIDRIAHDLKTPFFGAREIFQLILNDGCGKIQPELEPLLLLLKETNEELLEMTQRLIEIYRYDGGRDSLQIGVNDLAATLKQSVSELQSLAKANEIALSYSCENGRFDFLFDRSALEKVLGNFVTTFIRHTSLGGSLSFKLERERGQALITLTATGLGMTQRDLDGIFLLARQRSASQSYSALAGLDLHLCRQIVHAHGGTLSAQDEAGSKVSIMIRLPLEI